MSNDTHVHVHVSCDCCKAALEQMQSLIMSTLAEIKQQGVDLMTQVAAFAAAQAAFNTQLDTAVNAMGASVAGITGDLQTLNDKITALQNSSGSITPEDQALLDELQAQGAALAAKVQAAADALAALDALTPPTPPSGP